MRRHRQYDNSYGGMYVAGVQRRCAQLGTLASSFRALTSESGRHPDINTTYTSTQRWTYTTPRPWIVGAEWLICALRVRGERAYSSRAPVTRRLVALLKANVPRLVPCWAARYSPIR